MENYKLRDGSIFLKEVSLKVLILFILGIIIGESRCIHNKKALHPKDNYIAFISGYDTIYIEKDAFSISFSSNEFGDVQNKFIINLMDSSNFDRILKMKRPDILIRTSNKSLIGKSINYNSSNPPPNVDFFFLLAEGSDSRIWLVNGYDILCYIRNKEVKFKDLFSTK